MKLIYRILIFSLLPITLIYCNDQVVTIVDPPPATIKYLALGDSYTIGQSVEINERYPIQLADKLKSDGFEVDTTVIIAKTGWRTDDLIAAIDASGIEGTFDIVSLLIGVNNQYQGKTITQYEKEFPELLATAVKYAGGDSSKVFVLSIPDYGFTPFGENNKEAISAGIDTYNSINKTITSNLGISWFDITPISRNGLAEPWLVASDGLHPSGEMYKRWIDVLYEDVLNKLR